MPIADKSVDPQSGAIAGQDGLDGRYRPQAIFEANRAFQRLLVSQGMSEERARHYLLGGNYEYAWTRGQILLAVVYRHPGAQPFRATSKKTGIVTTFRPDQRAWHEPYERDASGQAIDEVIDWAATDYAALRHEKVVATLMVLAAEAVKAGKRAHDYWQAERRWLAGETAAIMRESRQGEASAPELTPESFYWPAVSAHRPLAMRVMFHRVGRLSSGATTRIQEVA